MPQPTHRLYLRVCVLLLGLWLGIRYLLPLVLPFLLGGALALGAERPVRFLTRRTRLPRWAASGIAVTAALALLFGTAVLLLMLAARKLSDLTHALPALTRSAELLLADLQDRLTGLADASAEPLRPGLLKLVQQLFSDGSALLEKLTQWLLGLASRLLGLLPRGLVAGGACILSAYMISARLPAIRGWAREHLPRSWHTRWLPQLRALGSTLRAWLKAQLKLSGVTLLIALAGLSLLGVGSAPVWALVISLVDAVPMLGTGTVLLPWALLCLLRGQGTRALGLSLIWLAATAVRTALEPRLVGRQLGLDPLVTLLALYAGFRLWGVAGMILSPMLAVTVTRLSRLRDG